MSLAGLKVIEFAGLAPGPFAGLILADHGASVIRVDRPSSVSNDILCRGKRSVILNPKIPSGREALEKLIVSADVVIDPFRPGVMERLGLGPEIFLGDPGRKGINEKLIYARIAGFPKTGAYKDMAGHDINYVALTGVLAMLPGTPGKPTFPLNLLADFAGGGLLCALGILLALIERGKSGRGQVVSSDMVSGTRYLASFPLLHATFPSSLLFGGSRGANILDGGAPFYDIYSCKGGGWMSVGCLEPAFFKAFIETFLQALPKHFALSDGWKPTVDTQTHRDEWPRLRTFLETGFMTNTRDYWADMFHGTDACAVPVLTPKEAGAQSDSPFPVVHPQIMGSQPPGTYHEPWGLKDLNLRPGRHTGEILQELGLNEAERRRLAVDGALGDDAQSAVRAGHKL